MRPRQTPQTRLVGMTHPIATLAANAVHFDKDADAEFCRRLFLAQPGKIFALHHISELSRVRAGRLAAIQRAQVPPGASSR